MGHSGAPAPASPGPIWNLSSIIKGKLYYCPPHNAIRSPRSLLKPDDIPRDTITPEARMPSDRLWGLTTASSVLDSVRFQRESQKGSLWRESVDAAGGETKSDARNVNDGGTGTPTRAILLVTAAKTSRRASTKMVPGRTKATRARKRHMHLDIQA